ncbi:LysR family transcriptional regulator [Christensenellaceae bacterium OttesenSCG-928-M15]|nr:LysR family transcriptional regulator [Christensenellaceae bacterium OttesenSCG-928-M15]
MNIQHLKYILEVAKTGSISQAAENLYMGQPNLSKAIKDLEQTLHITIFKRTSKGAQITPKGQEFLRYAREILHQYEEIEALGQKTDKDVQSLYLSIPRASYIVYAFTSFLTKLDMEKAINVDFLETNALRTIRHVADGHADLGIIRCKSEYQNYFISLLEEHTLSYKVLLTFRYSLLLPAAHPLASKEIIHEKELQPFVEIIHGDTAIPHMPQSVTETESGKTPGDKKLRVYERGSQFDLLARIPTTYMWVSPMPDDLLTRNGIVQRPCSDSPDFVDILIMTEGHKYSPLEEMFIAELKSTIHEIIATS